MAIRDWVWLFREMGNLVGKAPNPFESDAPSKDDKRRHARLKEMAGFFLHRADDMREKAEIAELFDTEDGHEWLMDQIEEKLDIDEEWTRDDVATLAALFFLMTVPADAEENEGED